MHSSAGRWLREHESRETRHRSIVLGGRDLDRARLPVVEENRRS
jgi:hypothetical protein